MVCQKCSDQQHLMNLIPASRTPVMVHCALTWPRKTNIFKIEILVLEASFICFLCDLALEWT